VETTSALGATSSVTRKKICYGDVDARQASPSLTEPVGDGSFFPQRVGRLGTVNPLKRRNKITGQWAARSIEMLESPAYRILGLSAHRALSRIEVELAHHGGQDNGKLPVTFDDFVEYGIRRQSIGPALDELEALRMLCGCPVKPLGVHVALSTGNYDFSRDFDVSWKSS
jgi:hypothetical protein